MDRLATRTLSTGDPVPETGHKVVFLSGDVHYGYSTRLQYWWRTFEHPPLTALRTMVAAQLTSSALKNFTDTGDYFGLVCTLTLHNTGYVYGLRDPRVTKVLGWDMYPGRGVLVGSYVSIFTAPIAVPQVITATRPPTAVAGSQIWTIRLRDHNLDSGTLSIPPHWEYRVDYFHAFTTDLPFPIRADADPHNRASNLGVETHGIQLVGVPNIGAIHFSFNWQVEPGRPDDDQFFVHHNLWWRWSNTSPDWTGYPGDSLPAAPHSQFGVPLGSSYNAVGVDFRRPGDFTGNTVSLTPSQQAPRR
jgi:hypothetical protein